MRKEGYDIVYPGYPFPSSGCHGRLSVQQTGSLYKDGHPTLPLSLNPPSMLEIKKNFLLHIPKPSNISCTDIHSPSPTILSSCCSVGSCIEQSIEYRLWQSKYQTLCGKTKNMKGRRKQMRNLMQECLGGHVRDFHCLSLEIEKNGDN